MTFQEFIQSLTKEQVDGWWTNKAPQQADQKAEENNWKYKLRKNGKSLPFKWSMEEIAKYYNINFTTRNFSSTLSNRDAFCEAFDFEIEESLVFDKTELKNLSNLYKKFETTKKLFQDFIDYAHVLVSKYNIEPYKIRMAIGKSDKEAMIIIGMRNVLCFREEDGKAKVGFIVHNEVKDDAEKLNTEEYPYKGEKDADKMLLRVYLENWNDIPESILESNYDCIQEEYLRIKDTKRATWNMEASSTNSALKYIVFKKIKIEEMVNSKYTQILSKLKSKKQLYPTYFLKCLLDGQSENEIINRIQNLIDSKEQGTITTVLYRTAFSDFTNQDKDKALEIYKSVMSNTISDKTFGEFVLSKIFNKNNNLLEFLEQITIEQIESLLRGDDAHSYIEDKFEKGYNASSKKYHLNQILYGPPGTGKTYKTKELAANIAHSTLDEEKEWSRTKTREEIVQEYDRLYDEGQIVFTTFHQSMSYEDFVEGIKPKTKKEKVVYEIENGIFKNSVKNALSEYVDKALHKNDDFDSVYNEFVEYISAYKGKREGIFKTKTGVEIMLVDITENSLLVRYLWSNRQKTDEGQQTFTISKEKIKKVFNQRIIPEEVTNLKAEIDPIVGYIHCELFAVYKSFYKFIEEDKGDVEIIQSNTEDLKYSDIFEVVSKLTKEEVQSKKVRNHVLIIDEINRANVSAVFGELITLLEPDKRLGEKEEVKVKLPYSKDEDFGIPINLYIIGTMNTADRSVEALDTALRRRFEFKEVMPQSELLTTSAMYCRFLWKYEGVSWDDKEFDLIENAFFKLFSVSEDFKKERKNIWEKMTEDNDENKLDYFDKFKNLKSVNLDHLLATINNRIEVLLDRDHTIGHSYFIKVVDEKSLMGVFKNSIIPLLQEYFYGDYEKIAMVLGAGFFENPQIYDKTVFADLKTQNSFEKVQILRLKSIDEKFEIIPALKKLLKIDAANLTEGENE